MRTQVKHLLRKYEYPPEKAKGAVDIVIKQAELMSSNIKPTAEVYDFQVQNRSMKVAEESASYTAESKQQGEMVLKLYVTITMEEYDHDKRII